MAESGAGFNKPQPLRIKGNLHVEWSKWKTNFETFLCASGYDNVTDKRKISMLINLIGEDGQELLNNFEFIREEDKNNFEIVLAKFDEYCAPRKYQTLHRFNFFNIQQHENETFESFLTELRTKASSCEFGDQEDSLIRDRIICGLWDKGTQNRLLREQVLTLDNAIEYCIAAEVSKWQAEVFQEQPQQAAAVKKSNKSKIIRKGSGANDQLRRGNERSEEIQCAKCNQKHEVRACPAFGQICSYCQGRNHFAIACKKKNCSNKLDHSSNFRSDSFNRDNRSSNHGGREIVQGGDESDENIEYEEYFVSTIEVVEPDGSVLDKGWFAEIKVDDNLVKFKLVTGTAINVIPYSVFKGLVTENKLEVRRNIRLVSYVNQKSKAMGKITMLCKINDKSEYIEFVIADLKCKPILGMNGCMQLGFTLFKTSDLQNGVKVFS